MYFKENIYSNYPNSTSWNTNYETLLTRFFCIKWFQSLSLIILVLDMWPYVFFLYIESVSDSIDAQSEIQTQILESVKSSWSSQQISIHYWFPCKVSFTVLRPPLRCGPTIEQVVYLENVSLLQIMSDSITKT